ncbi:tRNA 2-thiouridine(34) synthase MnmA [Candidatus Wolfebacteria bacterium]|nr:tRNA 2-thiouridine(34) synthase MnmA [Candidatus Wolfebacteria bacterium]
MKRRLKVFVAMSGGVDSSVAAFLLKKQGYDVVGIFMRCYNLDGCAERDAEDARRVAEKLKIPFYVWDFEEEYKEKVVDYMVQGYKKGITPNPDVMCNKEIKFGLFLKRALLLGADYISTGHYVRRVISKSQLVIGKENPKLPITSYQLLIARDQNKDQSYFLWTLTQEQLKHCLFPIGDYLKSEVREIARKAGLPTADKKDSQGICFLGKVTLGKFLKNYIPEKPGAVLTTAGTKIGEHQGAHFYTIGQRHLGIKNYELGIKGRHEIKPHYVAEKNVESNTLIVVEGDGNPALYKNEIYLCDVNFINQQLTTNNPQQVWARVRYRQPLVSAQLIRSCKSSVVSCKLKFDHPIKFIAPGQSAVLYSKGGELLGGGVITNVIIIMANH